MQKMPETITVGQVMSDAAQYAERMTREFGIPSSGPRAKKRIGKIYRNSKTSAQDQARAEFASAYIEDASQHFLIVPERSVPSTGYPKPQL